MANKIQYSTEAQNLEVENSQSNRVNTITVDTPNNNTLVVPTDGQQPLLGGSDIYVDDINYLVKVIGTQNQTSVPISETAGAIIFANDENTTKEINDFIKIKLSSILIAPAERPYTITIKKNGYTSNQKYVFRAYIKQEFDNVGRDNYREQTIPKNSAISLYITEFRGESKVRNIVLNYPDVTAEISFTLQKDGTTSPTTQAPTNTITIDNTGLTDSVVVLKDGANPIKLTNGINKITGTYSEKYTIKSNDLSRFIISKAVITDSKGVKTEKIAENGQSLSLDFTLNTVVSYSVVLTIGVPDLITASKIPVIIVDNKDDSLKYNANSREDFEFKIQKNEFVENVTVYIANEVYEYRELNNKEKTASIRIPFFAFKSLGNFKVYLVPSNINGDGNRVETFVSVVDDEFIPIPDLRRIKYPSILYGADYKGTNVDFEISWESINANFVRIYNSANEIGKFIEVSANAKVNLNVQKLIDLNPSNFKNDASTFRFELSLVPYNTTGREVVKGKKETIAITFNKSDKVIPKSMAINRIAEAFANKFDTSVFEKETSKFLTHNLHFSNNVDTEVITTWTGSNGELILKLYEPLPKAITNNEQAWISKVQSNPIIETITLYGESKNFCTPLKGPNFQLDTDNGIAYATYSELIASGSETSNDIVNKYANNIGIDTEKLNIQYVSGSEYVFENFVNFSSAEERVENFYYKVKLIQLYKERYEALSSETFQAPYEDVVGTLLAQTTATHPLVLTHDGAKMVTEDGFFEIAWEVGQFSGVSQANEANKVLKLLNNLINNLDGWEKFLYSDVENLSLSYPKELYINPFNGLTKYVLKDVNDSSVTAWYNSLKILAAIYDKDNANNLVNNIPEYIQIDSENNDFILFLNMIGQHFDILWTYINSVKDKKILEEKQSKGIANNLVYHMLKSLGWDGKKAFQSNNLWEYAFGKDKDGFTKYGTSLEDANNQVWRRILNNLPYLLKNKGTSRAMKAIMACYGVPQSMLTIMEFGGPQNPTNGGTTKFTFEDRTAALFLSGSLNASGSSTVKIPWKVAPGSGDYPNCIEVRILPQQYPNPKYSIISGSDWTLDLVKTTGSFGKLELNFGGDVSPSTYFDDPVLYPGDTPPVVSVYISPEASGVYAFGPDLKTGSLDFPISLENYSQILINRHNSIGSTSWFEVWLATTDGKRITTFVSMSLQTDDTEWENGTQIQIGGDGYQGMVDEFRLWEVPLKRAKFENHTLFPNAINGNSYTGSTADLIFRLDFEYPKNRKAGDNGVLLKDVADPNIKNVSINTSYGENYAVASNMYSANSYPYQYIPYDRDVTADVPSTGFNYSNKIRFESASLVGDLSYKNRATKKAFDQAPIDSNRLGIFLSPIKELNMDILKAFGDEFNIDNYIGDPSDDENYEYKELATIRNYYFDRYQNTERNIYEYIQLVRYIDKSLFEVLEDLAPARAAVSKGLLIEPHFLERSKTKWDKPKADRPNYDGLIDYAKDYKAEFNYNVEETTLDAVKDYEFNNETPYYDGVVDGSVYSDLDAEKNDFQSTIDYTTYNQFNNEFPTYPNTGSANVNCVIEGLLEGIVDTFEYIQIGMDANSLQNAGFGLYGIKGNSVVHKSPEPFGFSDWKSGSRASVFLVKEQYTKKIKTQLRGYPTTRSLTFPNEQVYYEDMPVTKTKYKISVSPFTSSIELGNETVQVDSINGYFPTHYKFVNNLSEGMKRSFWKGSMQTDLTTPDGLPAVEVFNTNPNILRVAKTGRGSGEPILEVD